jgi:hypothetical protein
MPMKGMVKVQIQMWRNKTSWLPRLLLRLEEQYQWVRMQNERVEEMEENLSLISRIVTNNSTD